EEDLLAAIREREPGKSALDAFADFMLEPHGVLAFDSPRDPEATEQLRTITHVITESPALLARERQVFARYAESLAALLAEETGAPPNSVEPVVAAATLMGAHRALIDYVRRRTLAGDSAAGVARGVRAEAKKAFTLLRAGLGDY